MTARLVRARRGQVFAMDALLAIFMLFLLLSLVRTARGRLQAERDEWAARFALEKSANDLIDTLVREPGQLGSGSAWECTTPESCAVSTLVRPGLAHIDTERRIVRPAVLDARKVRAFFTDHVSDSQKLVKDYGPYVRVDLAPSRGAPGRSIEIGDANRTSNPRLEKVSITRVVVVLEPGGGRTTQFLTLTLAS